MPVSLAMSVLLPQAFGDLGLWVGGAYAVQQIGRTVFMVIALRGHPLRDVRTTGRARPQVSLMISARKWVV